MRLLLIVTLLISALAVACGGGGSEGAGAATLTLEELEARLLSLEDLSTGWSVAPDSLLGDDEESEETDGSDTLDCEQELPDDEYEPLVEAEVTFQKSEMGPFLYEMVGVFEGSGAEDAFDFMEQGLDDCDGEEWTETEDGVTSTLRLSKVSFPEVGDESVAARMSIDIEFLVMEADVAVIREGNMLVMLMHMGMGSVDTDETADYAERALEKLTE